MSGCTPGASALGVDLRTSSVPDRDERDSSSRPGTTPITAGGPVTPVLSRGQVMDLPMGNIWTVNVAWRAGETDVDVVALVLDAADRVVSDQDVVFYNAPSTENGSVSLSVDGDGEQGIHIDLDLLPEHCTKVVVAAALDGEGTFGDLGAVTMSVDAEDSTACTATLDAGTTERTMRIGELYRRGDLWRLRAVGQGFDDGLAQLLARYGADAE